MRFTNYFEAHDFQGLRNLPQSIFNLRLQPIRYVEMVRFAKCTGVLNFHILQSLLPSPLDLRFQTLSICDRSYPTNQFVLIQKEFFGIFSIETLLVRVTIWKYREGGHLDEIRLKKKDVCIKRRTLFKIAQNTKKKKQIGFITHLIYPTNVFSVVSFNSNLQVLPDNLINSTRK